MRVLLDNCVDVRFARHIVGHDVRHCRDQGWQDLSNGRLLSAAEEAGFSVLVTVDKNVRHQQKLSKRRISLVTLNPRFTQIGSLLELVDKLHSLLQEPLPAGSDIVIAPE